MSCEKAHIFGNWDKKKRNFLSLFRLLVVEECNRWASYFFSINTSDIYLICLATWNIEQQIKKTLLAKWKWLLEILAPILFWKVNFPFMSFLNIFPLLAFIWRQDIRSVWKKEAIKILEKWVGRATIIFFSFRIYWEIVEYIIGMFRIMWEKTQAFEISYQIYFILFFLWKSELF